MDFQAAGSYVMVEVFNDENIRDENKLLRGRKDDQDMRIREGKVVSAGEDVMEKKSTVKGNIIMFDMSELRTPKLPEKGKVYALVSESSIIAYKREGK